MQLKATAPLFVWRFANAEFDEASRELRVAGCPVDMEPRPLEVLLELLRHAGEVVAKEDLLNAVYGHRHLSDGALAQAVRRLRRALQDDGQLVIATVHRVGYKLAVDVNRREIAGQRSRPLLLKAGESVPRREHWRLLHPLGGSEVEVWLIEHVKTRARRVLKLCTDAQRLSALKREVTLFRVLKDTLGERGDLVALIDWNFDASPYFIECEYGGITLVEWAESLGGLAAIPLEHRIELIAAAADAVAAAHSADVLHKDLKPTNVLAYQNAAGKWCPRLIDFGSGRLLEPDRLDALRITQQGFTQQYASTEDSPGGTPLYLAPELAAGQMPTPQTDVYALGVMLYQIVVGNFRQPLTTGWEDDVQNGALRADIAFATHGNPLKRMKSAADLAARLRALDARSKSQDRTPAPASRRLAAWPRATIIGLSAALVAGGGIGEFVHHAHQPSVTMGSSAIAAANDAYLHALTVSHRRQVSVADWQELIETLRHATALDPNFASAWALLAQQYAHLYFNHYEPEASRIGATRALAAATRLQPNSPDTLIAQGYFSYWVDSDYAAANAVMQTVHERWPEKIDATIALARIAVRQGRAAQSARFFEEALEQDRLNMEVVYGAAGARMELQQFPAALKLADYALDIAPADVQGIGLKAHIYQRLGELDQAAAVLRSVANRPGDFDSVGLLAEQARLQRDYTAAIALWRAYLANPEPAPAVDTSSANQELGHLLLMHGDQRDARATLQAVRKYLEDQRAQLPSDPRPVGHLALVYADLEEYDMARALANSAASFEVVRRDAARVAYYEAIRATVAARTGDKDQAFASLNMLATTPSGSNVTPGLLAVDPEWDSLRADPRFDVLLGEAVRAASRDALL